MKIDLLLTVLAIYVVNFGVSRGQPPPVTEVDLHQVAASLQMYVDELPDMAKLYGYTKASNGSQPKAGVLTIGMYQTTWKFHRDLPTTTVFAYGTSISTASVPGPTIETLHGTPTIVRWENHLPQSHILPWDRTIATAVPKSGGVPAVVHLHGGIHPPMSDGNPLAWFTSGFNETGPSWSEPAYTYPNVQHAGSLWYHDHALGLTRINILAGLLGAYIVRDPFLDAKLNLPSGPEFERPLMVFDRSFYKDGSLYMNYTGNNPTIHPQWQPEYFGDAIIVNGKAWPYLKVKRRKYRFHIINASNARYFRFSLSSGLSFIQVGSDASFLPSPVATQTILLAPAEIADVIIDFSLSTVNETVLSNDAPYPYPTGNPVDSLNSKVMKFVLLPDIVRPTDSSTVPTNLKQYKNAIPAASTTRYIVLYEYQSSAGTPTHLYINGKSFFEPVTETPKSGTTEIWHVINLTGDNHPLHIHLSEFQAIKIQQLVDLAGFTSCMTAKNDALSCNVTAHVSGSLINVSKTEMTWKNVVKIEPGAQTTIVVKFNLIDDDGGYPFDATAAPGYVYHCHILDHEDNEMVRPLKLVP